MKQKTAMQIAIKIIKESAKTYPIPSMENGILLVVAAKLEKLLPTEREQIEGAWVSGYMDRNWEKDGSEKDYFTDKYEQ